MLPSEDNVSPEDKTKNNDMQNNSSKEFKITLKQSNEDNEINSKSQMMVEESP